MANPLEEMNFFSNPEELKSALMEQAHKVFFCIASFSSTSTSSRSCIELFQFGPVIKKIVSLDITFGSIWPNHGDIH